MHRRQPESMKRLYNWFYRYYGLVEGSIGPKVGRIISSRLAPIPGIKKMTAIEYACGSGVFTLQIAKLFRTVEGRDASIGMLERARTRAKSQNLEANFREGDILRISESAGSYDYAFVSFALHLFPPDDVKRILKNLLKVSRVAVMAVDHGRKWDPLTAAVEWMEGGYYDMFIRLDFAKMAMEIGAAGFEESQEEGLSFLAFYKERGGTAGRQEDRAFLRPGIIEKPAGPPAVGQHPSSGRIILSGTGRTAMDDFPDFMKNPANRIAPQTQYTRGIEGYLFDGADGSQMAVWINHNGEKSARHVHEYDEYFLVVQGQYTLILGDRRIPIGAGEEWFIPKGVPHSGESTPGTRTIHAFGGRRANRKNEDLAP